MGLNIGEYLQLADRQTVMMLRKERFHRLAGVVGGAVLNDDQVLSGLRHHLFDKGLIGDRVETPGMRFVKQGTTKVIDEAQDLVGLAPAAGLDGGLLTGARPSVAQRPPLGKTALVTRLHWPRSDQLGQLLSL